MSITVGTDTYVTILEADAYIELHYVSTDTQRVAWEALSDADKEIYLRNATSALEQIPYRGIKAVSTQALAFPRCYKSFSYISNVDSYYAKEYGYYCESEAPDNVKYAEIHEALENASPASDSDYFNTMNSNVKSYSITGLSETFQNVSNGLGGVKTLVSKKAQQLIHRYSGGGFGVN